ncbi:hypothetical protein ILUMI_04047 [Ignelater luminosus]|uniref:Farnesol dehydrogenase n=1 Tax=Ignelater luminosus TaxID=2038154 RepID=A0A8K0DAE5_IGNLU|nr:hypothetical protein ILUMI_04047 [Ignelater luminosus]
MAVSVERWKGKVAVVTGASSGIGAAIAEQLVQSGFKVVGLARRKERMDELAKQLESKSGKLYAFQADVTKEEDILKAFEWIKENVEPVHVLINNAGIAGAGNLRNGKTDTWKRIIDTNVLGLCIVTREAIKHMRANNVDGHIVHINSLMGHRIVQVSGMNIYPASKHAVTALTETLRQELNSIGSKIKISSVSPGYVKTEIFESSCKASGLPGIPATRLELLEKLPSLQAKDVADAVLYILATPPHVQIHELIMQPVGEPY